ncbi:MAG: LamG-like jellyroll fold domain-containing protein [Planctomycetia bacterium]|nr:LamG-like jellyroll fold domain-containing protein [Planctomycetia bacterium]
MLSVVPGDGFHLLNDQQCLTQSGWLVYSVMENDTSNRTTSLTVSGTQLGGDGGEIIAFIPVQAGDPLPNFTVPENCKIRQDAGLLPTIRVEDFTDNDYDDLVISLTFITDTLGPIDPSTCDPCACSSIVSGTDSISDPSDVLTIPKQTGFTSFRAESILPTGAQTMTATLQMGTLTKTVHYDTSTFDSSEKFAVGMHLDTSSLATGRYAWTMTFTYKFTDGSTQTQTASGHENLVNLSASPYGAGINVSGNSSLDLTNLNASDQPGIHWQRSCGKQVWFAQVNNSFVPEPGESSASTLTQNAAGTFTLTDQGETFHFNSAGQLLTRVDNLTNETTSWTYHLDGTIATKTDAANRTTTFTYTAGKLSSVTDAAGRVTTYTHDALGRLIRITQPDPDADGPLSTPTTTFTYDGTSARVSTITHADGTLTAYTYLNGQVTTKTVNGITQFSQDPYLLSAVVDTTQTGYDADHPALLPTVSDAVGTNTDAYANATSYRYDAFGNIIWQKTASGLETVYLYDANGRLRKETETVMLNGKAHGRDTTYDYDLNGNLIQITYHDGSVQQWTYDATFNQPLTYTDQLGRQTLYTLDSTTGLTTSVRQVVGEVDSAENAETNDILTFYTYDANRRLSTETDALGIVTAYTYDANGNLLTQTDAAGTPQAATTTYTYDTAHRLTSVTNALNQTTSYTYDALDRLISTTYASGQSSQNAYNSLGQLVQSTDLNGATTTYNAAGQLATVTSPGSSVTYTYNAFGQIATQTDSLNRVTSYTYNAAGKLIATTISDATQTAILSQTTYDVLGRTATQTDAAGVTLRYTYDKFDRITRITRTNDNLTLETRSYDALGNLLSTRDAMNRATTYTYDALGNLTRIVQPGNLSTSYTYDAAGRLLTQTNPLNQTSTSAYDLAGNLTSSTDPTGATTFYTYNSIGQLITSTDPLGTTTSYTYDSLGRTLSTTISNSGGTQSTSQSTAYTTQILDGVTYQIVTTTDALNHVTTSRYNLAGQLLSQTDATGATTFYTYDTESQLTSTTDALNHTTTYTYDTFGNVSTITDAAENTTSYRHNAAGQLLSQTDPTGATTFYTYNLDGQLTRSETSPSPLPGALATWLNSAQSFDSPADAVTLGNDSSLNFSGQITLSAWVKPESTDGLRVILTHGHTATPKREVFLRIHDGKYQVGSWNGSNHLVEFTIPAEDLNSWTHLTGTYDGSAWNLYRNGELVASSDDATGALTVNADWVIGANVHAARSFDGEIRSVAIWNSALAASEIAYLHTASDIPLAASTSSTSYTYDPLGRLLSLTDPLGNTTSYTYNTPGNLTSETNENNATRHFTYDALGRLVSKTDRNDRVTTYTYDAAGRLTSEKWLDENDAILKTFTYTYDLVGNLLTAGDGTSAYTYTYNYLNLPTTTTFTYDAQTALFTYTYDALGRQTSSSLTLNNTADRTNTTTYDYLGRATSIGQHGNITDEIFAEFDHDANGLMTQTRRYEWNASEEDYTEIAKSTLTYNSTNAVTSITHQKPDGTPIVQHSYTYDETNNIVQYLNSIDGSTTYDYDYLGQLISADYASAGITDESYTYDANGNRVTANGSNYTTGTNNELTSDGAWSYVYDDEGNRISKQNSTNRELYEWDYRNRLTKVTQQEFNTETETWTTTQIVEYAYDFNNVWIRKILDSNGDGTADAKTIFIPESYQTAIQLDDTNLSDNTDAVITHRYLWTPQNQDKLLADQQITSSGTETLWSLTDHLGTIRDIIQQTSSGLVVPAHIIYDAYGNVISCKDSTGTSIDNPILFGYTGKAFDVSTQLQNNINRWYDATIGRWLTTDPIGFEGNDTNLYRYVKNSPVSYSDPSGLLFFISGCNCQKRAQQPNLTDKQVCDILYNNKARGTNIVGMVARYRGRIIPCSFFENVKPLSLTLGHQLISQCTIEHEKSHIKDWENSSFWVSDYGWKRTGCDGVEYMIAYGKYSDLTECRAYRVSLNCATRARTHCAGNIQCERYIDSQIHFYMSKIIQHCK